MKPDSLILIGASAGALEALSAILPALPAALAAAIVVVVHMGPADPGLLPELFAARCQLRVKEAEDKEPLAAGTVYFAPVDYHLLVERELSFALSCEEPINFSRPSIDALLESAAETEARRVLAVVLSGANSDGAIGAAAVARRGGAVFVQAPASAFCPVMPEAAIAGCPAAVVIPLPELAPRILEWLAC